MTFDTRLQESFKRHTLTAPKRKPDYCPYAEEFAKWAEELCDSATTNPTSVSINQAKVRLVDKWGEWRAFVPKRHRAYTGSQHDCIFHVFDTAYARLRTTELSLTPPMLFAPEPVRPRPAPQIAGIFIGEMEEE